jgi:hypothetical protein
MLMSCRARARPLHVPQVEALKGELNTLIRQRADPFHDELIGRDDFFTGIALLAIRLTAREARDAVVGEDAG